MNCNDLLPFGSYLRPIEKMEKGGRLANKSDSDLKEMMADLRREIDEELFLSESFFTRLKEVKAEIARRGLKMEKGGEVTKSSGTIEDEGKELMRAINKRVIDIDNYFDKHAPNLPGELDALAHKAQQGMRALSRAIRKHFKDS